MQEEVGQIIKFNHATFRIKYDSDDQVLIPVCHQHDIEIEMYAFISEYLAKKYKCQVKGYIRRDMKIQDLKDGVTEVYKSFNAHIINPECNVTQSEQAKKITDDVWSNINSFESWNHITIFGIEFGVSIIRDHLRYKDLLLNPCDIRLKKDLLDTIRNIVFWHDYFESNTIKAVVLYDGVSSDSYIREFALHKNIPAYIINLDGIDKPFSDYFIGLKYRYYDKFWNELSVSEKNYGRSWAKKYIHKRILGDDSDNYDLEWNGKVPFSTKRGRRILPDDGKVKILICPHIFDEDGYHCGSQLFDNNYISWLCHIGELSDKHPEYGWYLKMHPWADLESDRDSGIINELLSRYHSIRLLPSDVVVNQLYDEGVRFALTIQGSIGHEYPIIGINVINAGHNPHEKFDININPESKEEYDHIIDNLNDIQYDYNKEDMCRFYAINYLYYNHDLFRGDRYFFLDNDLMKSRVELLADGKDIGAWRYEKFLDEASPERVEIIRNNMIDLFDFIDGIDHSAFYRIDRTKEVEEFNEKESF